MMRHSILLLVLLLAACNSSPLLEVLNTAGTPANLESPGNRTPLPGSSSLTASPVSDLSTPALIPTLTDLQLSDLLEALQDPNCELPCFLGINPTMTTAEEAIARVKSLGGTTWTIVYPIQEDPEIGEITLLLDFRNELEKVTQIIKLTTIGPKIIRIRVDIWSPYSPVFYDFWNRYSIVGVFQEIGMPTSIHVQSLDVIDPTYGIEIIYQHIGLLVSNQGPLTEREFCPTFIAESTTAITLLWEDENHVDEINGLDTQRGVAEYTYWPSISEILNMTNEEFYYSMLADPTTCFEAEVP